MRTPVRQIASAIWTRAARPVSATETNAYPGTVMTRTLAVIKRPSFDRPFVLDIFNIESAAASQYDLPFYFMGQVIDADFEYEWPGSLQPLGAANGYQHLYVEGRGQPESDNASLSWLEYGRFFTLTTATDASDELLFTRIGASDPEFNLRRDAALMIRRKATGNTVFASVIESHGGYSPVSELAVDSNSNIARIEVLRNDGTYTVVSIEDVTGSTCLFFLARKDASRTKHHELELGGRSYRWNGPYQLIGLE